MRRFSSIEARNSWALTPVACFLRMRSRRLTSLLLATCSVACLPATASADPSALGDFNGDGFADLAVSAPGESVGVVEDAGAVHVIYGSLTGGLSSTGSQLWHQDRPGIQDSAETSDFYGDVLTTGNLNGDAFADLIVGVPDEGIGARSDAGAVNVIYGSAGGLDAAGSQFWHQNSAGIEEDPEASDRFGVALATGDLNNNGADDLAVGVSGEDVGSAADAGAAAVIYGTGSGLTSTNSQLWHQNSAGIADAAETGDSFGRSLAVGDFDDDAPADLAIGASGENIETIANAGAANVIYGGFPTLTSAGSEFWHQDKPGILDSAETDDALGFAAATGDFDADGVTDLALGAVNEDVGTTNAAGAVSVLYGTATTGLSDTDDQFWHQNSTDILDAVEAGDGFGRALAVDDFDGDTFDDLAVSARLENVGTTADAGAANVIYGAAAGLTDPGNQFWHQNSSGIAEAAETSDFFAFTIAAGDLDGDGFADLAVGVPSESVDGIGAAGASNVIYGSTGIGLSSTDSQLWHQNSSGIADAAETDDRFGQAVASGAPAP